MSRPTTSSTRDSIAQAQEYTKNRNLAAAFNIFCKLMDEKHSPRTASKELLEVLHKMEPGDVSRQDIVQANVICQAALVHLAHTEVEDTIKSILRQFKRLDAGSASQQADLIDSKSKDKASEHVQRARQLERARVALSSTKQSHQRAEVIKELRAALALVDNQHNEAMIMLAQQLIALFEYEEATSILLDLTLKGHRYAPCLFIDMCNNLHLFSKPISPLLMRAIKQLAVDANTKEYKWNFAMTRHAAAMYDASKKLYPQE